MGRVWPPCLCGLVWVLSVRACVCIFIRLRFGACRARDSRRYRKALSCGACRAQVVVLPAHAVVLALASSTADWDGRSHIACNIGGENRSLAVAHDADAPVFLWSGSSDEGALSLWTTLSQRALRLVCLLRVQAAHAHELFAALTGSGASRHQAPAPAKLFAGNEKSCLGGLAFW